MNHNDPDNSIRPFNENHTHFLIIGDSHAGTLLQAFRGKLPSGRPALFEDMLTVRVCKIGGKSAYSLDYDEIGHIPNIDGQIILAYFGECDIRNNLPKYDNAEEVVDIYIKKTQDKFSNNEIYFIQPAPQHIDNIESRFSFEDRYVQQGKFYHALLSRDIKVIKINDWLGKNILTKSDSDDDCHYNDELATKLAHHIYKVVTSEIGGGRDQMVST